MLARLAMPVLAERLALRLVRLRLASAGRLALLLAPAEARMLAGRLLLRLAQAARAVLVEQCRLRAEPRLAEMRLVGLSLSLVELVLEQAMAARSA